MRGVAARRCSRDSFLYVEQSPFDNADCEEPGPGRLEGHVHLPELPPTASQSSKSIRDFLALRYVRWTRHQFQPGAKICRRFILLPSLVTNSNGPSVEG